VSEGTTGNGATPETSPSVIVVAAFDFDGTLSTRDNLVPFLRQLVGTPRVAGAVVRTAPRLIAAALSDRRRDVAKAALLRRLLTGRDTDTLGRCAETFASDVVARHLRSDALERVEWHRRQGHALVMVSASLAEYLRPIGERLGFDAVLATELERGGDGRLSGELAGANVRRAEKARRLDEWLGSRPAFVWAYGDSRGDQELFERADRPVRVGGRRRVPWSRNTSS
jgi:phosphatidylglycerophosphatase C